MEQIETQASDLRYLAQAPVALSDTASVSYDDTPRPGPHGSPSGSAGYGDNSAAPGSASNTNKRKSVDDAAAQKQTRSKRNRYISIACNECKRRKIKCNGETPCQRCGNLNLACLYAPNCCSNGFKDSDEFKSVTTQLSRLQDEVEWLNQTIKNMQPGSARCVAPSTERMLNGGPPSVIAPSPSQSSASMPRHDVLHSKGGPFCGPTSMAFSLDVANNTIANMGYRAMDESDDQDLQGSDVAVRMPPSSHGYDPLLDFGKDEMVRLCRVHEDESGIMYPVLSIHSVIAHAKNIAPYLESARNVQQSEVMNDEKTLRLKMVMCCALAVESHGYSEKATRLYESMEAVVNRKLMSDVSDVTNIPLLALLAGYRFLSNEEVLSWRVIGQVMRLCLEVGIHQKRGLMKIQNESERKNALNSFWSAYVLDRRWAFATGLPFAVQDDEIDPNLPFPDEYPFLVAMITYSRIGAKVWRQVTHFGPVLAHEPRQEEIDNLDREILEWYEKVPDEVRVRNWDREKQITSTPSYNLQRLRIWTYLRLNQIRIWLYTPVLHSATSIMQHPVQAQRVVDLARDTIQYLNHLNSTTSLYRRAQVFYHQFLASAIAVVFLASVHAPVRFSAVCREEFYMALDLVKDLSAKSWVSKRLWRTIKSLKDVAPRFGLNPDGDAHSNAALGMIGLAMGHMDGNHPVGQSSFSHMSMPQVHQNPSPSETSMDQNGKKIQNELSRIFEGYVGLNRFPFGDDRIQPPSDMTPDSARGMFTPDGTVFSHLREMF
ncbi:hypothetical protein C2857_005689 [Epichloe festucae Fl1]|uniref:Zn(2)-C6 fungal-type domain-containing protein n=1 Tax=Epichloe festucae (strain Fl1) TaxID=877507 RepID=A0A7S9KL77_EPIFF|nr:hypothetical protein C2857_005689 [Epichloe festucae Fl1]